MNKFKLTAFLLTCFVFLFLTPVSFGSGNSFVSIVNPLRGGDFWELDGQKPVDALKGQAEILDESQLPATWLVRFDALFDSRITEILQRRRDEMGLFLEVTPTWTKEAGVKYQESAAWHLAGSVFLTGYSTDDRRKLIDQAFEKFKQVFGVYPKSVGAWYLDSNSLDYMQKRYKIISVLIVADQYTTDNYQVWGQYWSAPYYPSNKNTLLPAQNEGNKLPLVVMQWAARDPLNGYGEGVNETTYSVQANDYLDFHDLSSSYFSKLIDLFLDQKLNQVNQLVIGLENSYDWERYQEEYQKQIQLVAQKKKEGVVVATMESFASWYQMKFPSVSPEHIIIAGDPLGTNQKVVWYMNPYYRAGWFFSKDGSAFRDIRQYVEGQVEPCYNTPCSQINFATFSTRVLDDVTYKKKLVLDEGRIKNFQVTKVDGKHLLSYENDAGRKRMIEFLPRDISIDGKISTIDGLILNTLSQKNNQQIIKVNPQGNKFVSKEDLFFNIVFKALKFLLFVVVALFIPGFVLVKNLRRLSLLNKIFLSICTGFALVTLLSFIGGLLQTFWLVVIYLGVSFLVFTLRKFYREISPTNLTSGFSRFSGLVFLTVLVGTFFQSWVLLRSGWLYEFGVGFWGPTGHDGIWHQALINQLIKQVPPVNPVFSGESLSNYHYFFDLLLATTFKLTTIPVADLLYRFYPVLFSLLLGLGTYSLVTKLTTSRLAQWVSLYFVYFAGSFGFIVTYLKNKTLGGESSFWVNQPVSMNLNPPFAASLILVIALILVIQKFKEKRSLVAALLLILLVGVLLEFKVYAGVLVLGGLLMVALFEAFFVKNFDFLKVFVLSLLVSVLIFLPQNKKAGELLLWSPFWFVHSMIDFPDRVGWARLSLARPVYLLRGEWFKFFSIETLSLLMFVVGNLGFRFFTLFGLWWWFKKKFWKLADHNFLFWMSLISLLIPLLFIQKGNPWNTIQFMYYFLYFAGLLSGLSLVFIFYKLPKILGMTFLLSVLFIAPLNSANTFKDYLGDRPPTSLSHAELEALFFLKSLPDGVVLTHPYDKNLRVGFEEPLPLLAYETTAYVSAYSGKEVFVEDEMQNEILQTDYRQRLVAAKDLLYFSNRDLLKSNNIRYVYLPKFYNVNIDVEKLGVKKIYENDEVSIYEVRS